MDAQLKGLLKKNIYIGTSSWKYGGWHDLVYKKKYKNEKEFNETCLSEYADHYSTVGIDHTFYAFPSSKGMLKYKSQTPDYFKMGLKVTEKITIFKYPKFSRYGKDAGKTNETFLSADLFKENFLEPLEDVADRIGPVMLEFSQFFPGTIASGSEFVELLDKFFKAVKPKKFQLAVEIRNKGWLQPAYFKMLAKHGVAHVFNSWTRMPTLKEQLEIAKEFDLPCVVSRVLLQPGTAYEQAVEAFSPYDKIVEKHSELREGAAALMNHAIEAGIPAYVFVNNRAEGCAPKTIEGILKLVSK